MKLLTQEMSRFDLVSFFESILTMAGLQPCSGLMSSAGVDPEL